MGKDSKIEWTDHTFNPWIGCQKVSPGCQFCYAEELMDKRYGKVKWGPQGTRVRTSDANWRKPLQWNRQARAEGGRYRVFCASLADVFEDRPELEPWRADLLNMIIATPHLDWLLLTKRPENVNCMIEQATGFSESSMWFHAAQNVWLGTSVENQAAADERIPHLLNVPAKVRFLSCEPLLAPVNLCQYYREEGNGTYSTWLDYIQWVICGGESGHKARPPHPDWFRSLRDQCMNAGLPYHFKQFGEWAPWTSDWYGNVEYVCCECGKHSHTPRGHCDHDWKGQAQMVRLGKHAAGRLLDSVEHNEFPQP